MEPKMKENVLLEEGIEIMLSLPSVQYMRDGTMLTCVNMCVLFVAKQSTDF